MVAPKKSLDDALDEIATLAPEDRRPDFRNLVRSTIDGVIAFKKLKGDDSIISESRAVMRNARALLANLKAMEKGNRTGYFFARRQLTGD